MVELSWYRVEVEMERGRKKKQGWVGMRGGDRAGSASDSAGFWPALRRCVGLRRYHPPPENKANDVVIWGGGGEGLGDCREGEWGMHAPRAKANSCGGAARGSGFPTG